MSMRKIQQFKKSISTASLVLFLAFLFSGIPVQGATAPKFFLESPSIKMSASSEFNVSVYLKTETLANALDIEISYPEDKLEFLDFNNARSIVDLWQAKPSLLANGNIGFSGGIIKSWSGDRGLIVNLSFRALSNGEAKLSFAKKDLYLADGRGTKISTDFSSAVVVISENSTPIKIEENTGDKTPPDLLLQIVKNPADGVSLIVFNATDPESGIKQSEIRFKKWWAYSDWQVAENPVIYPSGVWQVELRTMNNAGIENIKFISRPSKLVYKIGTILFALLFIVYVVKSVYNKREPEIKSYGT